MLSFLRNSNLAAKFTLAVFSFSLIGVTPSPLPAEESYPAVGRLSFISGPVTYSRGDDPDQWDDAVENLPLSIGDRIYAPEDGRAEVQLSSGNFVRLAPRSYLSVLNLTDDIKQFYLGEGAASFNIRRLPSDEVFEIDTPNMSVTFEEAGRYRVAVDDDGNTRVVVRRGRATVAASGRQIAVENSEIRVYGIDSPRYEIVGLPPGDAFDRWVSERDDRFERAYSDGYRHASEDIPGVEDLAEYGRWEEIPDYGYAWTPTRVAAGWLPFSSGRWYWQDPWGWTWISNERWGWATSHYGRWVPHRSRWYWVPVRPRTRVRYAPACVEFVRVRDHVGWFPLHPRDRHVPWWERRDRRFDRNVTYVNHTYVTVVNRNTFITARPVSKYIVRDSAIIRDARSARFTEDLPIPSRSSLRIISENGGGRRHKPAANVLSRTAVVRTAVPNPPRAFQEKLPEIQKNQGRAVEPARMLASANDDRGVARVRVRPAVEARSGDFAPRNSAAGGPAALQPVTSARGKKLATRETTGNDAAEKTVSTQKVPAVQTPQGAPGTGTAGRSELRPGENRDRQQDKQAADQAVQTQELERQKQAQQKDEERKAQLQKQQQERERQQAQERQAREQKQKAIEARQLQQKAAEHNAQAQKQQVQERQQEQRSREQRRLEELEQAQQREEQRKLQAQQNRQEQERREQLRQQQERQAPQQKQQELNRREQAQQHQEQQLRQQQAQERQVREQQRQQEVERRQQQQQREQERNIQLQQHQEQVREQQLRQQRARAQREAQEAQRQLEQERRPQPRQSQLPERPLQQPQKQ